jgi:hypothetical protein
MSRAAAAAAPVLCAASVLTAAPNEDVFRRYCVTCHRQAEKSRGVAAVVLRCSVRKRR